MSRVNSGPGHAFFWLTIFVVFGLYFPHALSTPGSRGRHELIISEFLAKNRAGLVDEDGDYSDWIEIYNPGLQPINLTGWSLTDDPNQPEKWTFPNRTLAGQAYIVIFASGKNRKSDEPEADLHTNFKLNQAGDFLGLYNVFTGRFVDIASPPSLQATEADLSPGYSEQFVDIAYGRPGIPSGNPELEQPYGYLGSPTPGRPNAETFLWIGTVAPISFNIERGFYKDPFQLELSTATSDAVIRYTVDGSQPSETYGTIYTGPITINSTAYLRAVAFRPNFRPSPVETHTYVFLENVLAQSKTPTGFPKTWGGYQGASVKADYEMDPEIVDHPRFGPALEDALKSIPTLAIVIPGQSFHDLYTNPRRRGRAWERPVSVELIDPNDEARRFQINAGLRIQGESGRLEFMPKHPFRLFFRSEHGKAKLEFPLFPESPVAQFDTLVLRSGVNRSYAGLPEFEQALTTYTRDEWLRTSQIEMSGSGSHGIFVHLYLNGLYWGLYNVIERPDASFMSSYFGGREDDWQTISHEETVSNSSERFKTLHKLAGAGRLADPARYAAIQTYLDIPHFIDYLILNWYAGNIDWAFNNWYANVHTSSGQVKYYVWDGERIWDDGAEIFFDRAEYLGRPNLVGPLIEALLENPDFRVELADHIYKHLFNDGPLTEANSQARWLRINNIVEQAIVAESARWGDVRNDPPLTQDDWFEARDKVRAQMEGNVARFIALARETGYYPEIDPPKFNQAGGQVTAGLKLTMTLQPSRPNDDRGNGAAIYFTTDSSDPRLPVTGAVAPQAQKYTAPLLLTTTGHIKARAFNGSTWSALNEAAFTVGAAPEAELQIAEIMYNPVGGDDYEFIELKNTGLADLDLADMSFEGIQFTFPAGSVLLAPGELMVLVRKPEAFARRYPHVAIDGTYSGQLSNKGERLTIKDASGSVIVSVEYDDDRSWPLSPDGRGDSLVLVNQDGNPNSPENWRASLNRFGSPGSD